MGNQRLVFSIFATAGNGLAASGELRRMTRAIKSAGEGCNADGWAVARASIDARRDAGSAASAGGVAPPLVLSDPAQNAHNHDKNWLETLSALCGPEG
jgi:hypothetical protein